MALGTIFIVGLWPLSTIFQGQDPKIQIFSRVPQIEERLSGAERIQDEGNDR